MTPAAASRAPSSRSGQSSAQRGRGASQEGRQSPTHASTPNGEYTNRLALSKQEAAEALGVSVDTIEQHMPGLRTVKLGRRVVIAVCELERWLDKHGAVHGAPNT